MPRILIADRLPEAVLNRFAGRAGLEIDNRAGITGEQLAEILPDYDGLVVRSRTRVTAELLSRAGRLKVIGRAGAGVDNIDLAEATRRGIIVMNTPGGNTIAATEHTIALMLAALRKIPQAYLAMQQERWDRKSFLGTELYEKTVGIIGLGKIGREVARRLAAFGTNLLGFDPVITSELAERLGVTLVDFDTLLEQSDIITVHVPRMPETINLINAENLQKCKPGVVLVNCARGGIINEAALLAALESGQVGAAALDVFESEPPKDWRLPTHPRVVATPHLGASTREAQAKVAEQILEQMAEYFQKQVARNAVNFVSVDESIQPLIAPYYSLAQALGAFFSQIRQGRIKEIRLRFYGEVNQLPVDPIASHLMAAALHSPDHREVTLINPVNAMTVARDKGIEIEISRKDHPLTSHTNLIACDFVTDQDEMHLAGTVYARGINRLVELNQFSVDANLSGKMVVVFNEDVPGVIGRVGTLLGDHRINIACLSSGRHKATGSACNIFNVEGAWNPDRLKAEIETMPHVQKVLLVELAEENATAGS